MRSKLRWIEILIFVLILINSISFSAYTIDEPFSGGSGTRAEPYIIASADDFLNV